MGYRTPCRLASPRRTLSAAVLAVAVVIAHLLLIANAGVVPSQPDVACLDQTWTFDNQDFRQYFNLTCEQTNIAFVDGMLRFTMTDECPAPTLQYKYENLYYARTEAEFKPSDKMGTATAFMRGWPNHTELDFEHTNLEEPTKIQSMYFVHGKRVNSETKAGFHSVSGNHLATEFHKYAIDYTPEKVEWQVDGKMKRQLLKKDVGQYPEDAWSLRFNIWNGGLNNADWAGETDWDNGPHEVYLKSITIKSYCNLKPPHLAEVAVPKPIVPTGAIANPPQAAAVA
ncbi:transglycosylase [Dimargaris xerosporica]|nr:transglycosylase [Dimargaris xerosporica]